MDLFIQKSSSTESLSQIEIKNVKTLLPQIIAALISASYSIATGSAFVYSSVLLPQLESKQADIVITKKISVWIASVFLLVAPISAVFGALFTERYGRLNGLKIPAICSTVGWIAIALAPDGFLIIVGRVILGLLQFQITNAGVIYITEISRKDVRGAFVSLSTSFLALGMVLTYIQGWFLSWRSMAWINLIYIFVPVCLSFLIPESPSWLVSKDRLDDAQTSLFWFCKNQPISSTNGRHFAELKLEELIEEEKQKRINYRNTSMLQELCKPACYKPLLIIFGLHFFQQLSGIYVFFFHSVYFFEASQTSINPFLGSIVLGLVRLLLSVCNTYVMKKTNRRSLLIITTIGMAISIFISGLFTYWIEKESTTLRFVPALFLLAYVVFSIFGLFTLPWTMSAEMFPLRIRAMAQGIATGVAFGVLFVVIQNFRKLEYMFGGFAGVQWFFSAMSLLGVVYIYAFVPETHGKKLLEIEEYFQTNIVYCRRKERNLRKACF